MVNEEYYELDFWGDLEQAVQKLQEWNSNHKNRKACITFNGHKLYSDTVTMDSAYLEVAGKTKTEFDDEQKRIRDEWKREEEEHKAKIPELTKQWVAEGHKILDEKYWQEWDKCVPIRLGDLYRGIELKMCLDIVKELNNGCKMDRAKEIIDSQGHSGMSWGLMISMVKAFCDRGNEFAEYVK